MTAAGVRRLAAVITLSLGLGTAQSPIEISLPSLTFLSAAGTLPLPFTLENPRTAISGIEFSVQITGIDLRLDTILTSDRTAGWLIQPTSSGSHGNFAFIMYDPSGRDLKPGNGPVALFMLTAPAGRDYAGHGNISVQIESASDMAGRELPTRSTVATITVGPVVDVAITSAQGDAGDTVTVNLQIDSPDSISQARIDITVAPEAITLIRAHAAPGLLADVATHYLVRGSATYRLALTADSAVTASRAIVISLDWVIAADAAGQNVDLRLGEVTIVSQLGRGVAVGSKAAGRISIYPGYLPAPSAASIDYLPDGEILLGWDVSEQRSARPDLTGFAIARGQDDEPLSDWRHVPRRSGASHYSAIDSSAVPGQRYRYSVAAVYDSVYMSARTEWIGARFLLPVEVSVQETPWHRGDPFVLPITMTNDLPISAFRFVLRGLAPLSLARLEATLNRRVPPDWVVALDSLGPGILQVSGQSSSMQTVAPGSGRTVTLTQHVPAERHRVGPIQVANITILDERGEALPSVGIGGAIAPWQPPMATVRIGSGQPVPPGAVGEITVYLENISPVTAMQMTLNVASRGIVLSKATAVGRLPAATRVHVQQFTPQQWSLIVSSPSNEVIAPGNGPVMTIAFSVDAAAKHGDRGVEVSGVGVSDAAGVSRNLPGTRGTISVGAVEVVVGGAELSVAPSRLVVVPILMAAARPLCSLSLQIGYSDNLLELIRVQPGEGWPTALIDYSASDGVVIMELSGLSGSTKSSAADAVVELIFRQKAVSRQDTTLTLPTDVAALDCAGLTIYSRGTPSLVHLTPPEQGPLHFKVPASAGGSTHFVTLRETTVGGAFLEAGDEVALLRTVQGGLALVGAGRVEKDGTVTILARPGMDADLSRKSRPTGPPDMVFQAWSRKSDQESLPSNKAVFVLGRGHWGENRGVTIIARAVLQNRPIPIAVDLPSVVVLEQNRPNPFRDQTEVRFGLPESAEVSLGIYNLLGRQVAVLHDGLTEAGYHTVVWDGRDDGRQKVISGLLFLQLHASGRTLTRKMILMP